MSFTTVCAVGVKVMVPFDETPAQPPTANDDAKTAPSMSLRMLISIRLPGT
jgi:hypothetical protein